MKSTSSFFHFICWMNKQKTFLFSGFCSTRHERWSPGGKVSRPSASYQEEQPLWRRRLVLGRVSSSGSWWHSPAMKQVFQKHPHILVLRLLKALYSLPFPRTKGPRAGGSGLPHCGEAALKASAEQRTLHVLEVHWLRFPELIKTLMARSLMQKNRSFSIDYSAKVMRKIRIASPRA